MTKRREFILKLIPLTGAALALPRLAHADVPALTEDDKMATAMGFRLKTENADQKKYPKHSNDQNCAKCIHYTVPGAENATCDLFKKLVPKGGWCSGFSKRP